LVELTQPTFRGNQAGKLIVDKGQDGAQSPDRADSVAMAFGAPLSLLEIWQWQ
jgi:hypothetical protein